MNRRIMIMLSVIVILSTSAGLFLFLDTTRSAYSGGTVAGYEGLLWYGQNHNHSGDYGDDGTGTIAANLDYMRNSGTPNFDVGGLQPHSHMLTDSGYSSYKTAVAAKNVEGSFIAFIGQEWSTLSSSNHAGVMFGDTRCSAANGDEAAFYSWLASSTGYAVFNHPGSGDNMNNYAYSSNADKPGSSAGKMIAMEQKQAAGSFTSQYFTALNNGWHIGATVSDDAHNGQPGDYRTNNPRTGFWINGGLTTANFKTTLAGLRFFATQDPSGYVDVKAGSYTMGDVASGLSASETIYAKLNPSLTYSEVLLYYKSGTSYTSKSMSGSSGAYTATLACNVAQWFFVRAKTSGSAYITSSPIWTTTGGGSGDTTAPTCSISSPTSGATVSGTTTISATASDSVGVTNVEFYVDSVLQGSDSTSSYSYSWATTSFTNAAHSLTVKAYDAAGNVGTSSAVSVTVSNSVSDSTAPTCSVSAPTSGATVSGSVTFSATASDNVGVTSVEFYVDSVLKTTDTVSAYSYTWDTTSYTNAAHSLYVKAYDAAGNVGTSSTISVTVNNAVQSYVLTSGVTSTGSISTSKGSQTWTITVPSGATSMRTILTGPSGYDYDLYGKLGSAPTTSSYTWSSTATGDEDKTYSSPGAGTWYLMAYAYSGTGSYSITCTITAGSSGGSGDSVKINEFLAAPASGDEWIELYNPTTSTVDIGGYKLDDITSGGTTAYTIPAGTTIAAGGFKVFYSSTTAIALNNDGDTVNFLSSASAVLDSYTYSSSTSGVSNGRSTDGGSTWTTFSTPTPGASNAGGGGGSGNVLTNGVASTGSLTGTGNSAVWTITVASGYTSMTVSVSHPTSSDFDTYGKMGATPTTSSYTWRGYTSNNPETVTYSTSTAGTWYIMVYSYSGSGSYTITCTFS